MLRQSRPLPKYLNTRSGKTLGAVSIIFTALFFVKPMYLDMKFSNGFIIFILSFPFKLINGLEIQVNPSLRVAIGV